MKTDSAERVCLHVNLKTGSKETGRGFHPSDVSRSHFGGWRSLKLMVSFWKLDRSVRLTSEDATIKSRLEAKTSGVTHRQKSAWKLLQFKVTGGISRNQTEKVQTQSSLVLTVTPEAAPLLGSIIKSNRNTEWTLSGSCIILSPNAGGTGSRQEALEGSGTPRFGMIRVDWTLWRMKMFLPQRLKMVSGWLWGQTELLTGPAASSQSLWLMDSPLWDTRKDSHTARHWNREWVSLLWRMD